MGMSLLTCCCGQPSSEVKGVASVGLPGMEGRCGEPASQPSLPVSGQSRTSTPGRMLQRYQELLSAGGIPGLRRREALKGLCGRGGACPGEGRLLPWPPFQPTSILCVSAEARGTVETLAVL